MLRRILIGVVAALAVLYVGDDLSARLPIPRSRNVYGKVTIERLDTIPHKNGKVEYIPEEPVNETCIHSLFPHMGYLPCWYLARKTEQRVNY